MLWAKPWEPLQLCRWVGGGRREDTRKTMCKVVFAFFLKRRKEKNPTPKKKSGEGKKWIHTGLCITCVGYLRKGIQIEDLAPLWGGDLQS